MKRLHESWQDVRLCLGMLVGMSYASPELRASIQAMLPHREHLPEDLTALLEAVEKQDAAAVDSWFRKKAIDLPDGGKLPSRLAEVVMRHHWKTVADESLRGLSSLAGKPVGELLAGMKELVTKLEVAGIRPVEK